MTTTNIGGKLTTEELGCKVTYRIYNEAKNQTTDAILCKMYNEVWYQIKHSVFDHVGFPVWELVGFPLWFQSQTDSTTWRK